VETNEEFNFVLNERIIFFKDLIWNILEKKFCKKYVNYWVIEKMVVSPGQPNNMMTNSNNQMAAVSSLSIFI